MTHTPTLAGKMEGPPPVSAELVEVVPLTAELVKANPETANLPGGLLANIEAGFRDAFAVVRDVEAEALNIRVTSVEQVEAMKRARELRLKLKSARVAAEQAAARKAAQAPDREKLAAFAGQVRELKVPEAKTEAGRAVAAEVAAKVEAFAKWIEGQASNL